METSDCVYEPARQTPVLAATDVVVAGGGPAGLVAAIAAARNGARVALVERHGHLGGSVTAALVGQFMGWTAGDRPIIGGIAEEVVQRLVASKGSPGHVRAASAALPDMKVDKVYVDPERMKCLADDLVAEAGVEPHLHTWVVGVTRDQDGGVTGVIVENKSGRGALLAKVTVDATGDADVAARAGAAFASGTAAEPLQPLTLVFRMCAVDMAQVRALPAERRAALMAEGVATGALPSAHLIAASADGSSAMVNMTRIQGLDGTRAADLTRAEIEGRRQVHRVADFLQRRVPGFERAYVCGTATQVGVRETRRVVGEYTLTVEDLLTARQFPDAVVLAAAAMDLHDPRSSAIQMTALPHDRAYGIPYGCLLPRAVEGLLVAGRCISSTQAANSSVRMMPVCMALGQAAGTAAALSAGAGVTPRHLDPEILRRRLIAQGAILDP